MSKKQTNYKIDYAYLELPIKKQELKHAYGSNIHIMNDLFALTNLAFLCQEKTIQPSINNIICDLYQYLIKVVLNNEFPRIVQSFITRMSSISSDSVWTGQVINKNTKTITVNILRAGSLPSQVCFDCLNKILDPKLVRQDHMVMSRITNFKEEVTGSHLGDIKIGGDINNTIMIFPDPMGATGSSLCEAIRYYKKHVKGNPCKIININLIITPEYLMKLKKKHPEVIVYAIRLDRGGSSESILKEMPGVRWQEESGLTDKQYIIPGGGGFGEIINNSYC